MLLYCPCKHTPCYCTVHVNTPHAIVLSMFLLCDKMWSFWEEANLCLFFYSLFIYVLPLEIQLSRGEGWDAINQFNTVTFLYLSQANSWISNFICRGFFCVLWLQLKWEVIVRFVDTCIGEIDDHHCLNFIFIIIIIVN